MRQIREVFALREPEKGEEVLTPPAPEPPPVALPVPGDPPPANPPAVERQTAARVADPGPRDSVEALVDELIQGGDLQRTMEGEIGALLEALAGAADMDQVRDILAVFGAGSPGPVADLLTRSTFAARVAGEVGAGIRG